MIPYILRAALVLSCSWLFYSLVLKRETFYRLNRWLLLGLLAVAFVLPCLSVPRRFSLAAMLGAVGMDGVRTAVVQKDGEKAAGGEKREGDRAAGEGVHGDGMGSDDRNIVERKNIVNAPVSSAAPSGTRHAGPGFGNGVDYSKSKDGGAGGASVVTMPAVPADGSRKEEGIKTVQSVNGGTVTADHSRADLSKAGLSDSIAPNSGLASWWQSFWPRLLSLLGVLWLSGVVFFGGSILLQLAIVLVRAYTKPAVREDGFRIVLMGGSYPPCSFGKHIFINPDRYDAATYRQILLHEKAHASQWHSLDILLTECSVALLWFNPCAWWYRKAVEINLEYLADSSVLQQPGIDRMDYQLSLLKVAAPQTLLSITSNYNQSLLKRRIIMMNRQHSPLRSVWKYFFLPPILALLVCVFNRPSVSAHQLPTNHRPGSSSVAHVTATPAIAGNLPAASADTNPAATPQTLRRTGFDTTIHVDANTTISTSVNATVTSNVAAAHPVVNVNPVVDLDVQPAGLSAPLPVPPAPVPDLTLNLPMTSYNDVHVRKGGRKNEDHSKGLWFASTKGDKLWMEWRSEDKDEHWSSSTTIARSEFAGLSNTVGKVEFKLVRDAGTMVFTGQFDGDQGFGHYTFQPDAAYVEHMRGRHIEMTDNDILGCYFINIKKNYPDMLQANGYPDINKENLFSMAAMGVSEEYIHSVRDNGYADLKVQELISFKAMGIDGAYLHKMKEAFGKDGLPSVQNVISYKAMGVDSAYVAELKRAGYQNLSFHELTSLKAMGINGAYIEGFTAIGYGDLSANDLQSMKSLSVNADYVKSFRDLGYQHLAVHELISLKSLGVTPAYVKGFQDIGYKDIAPGELNSLKSLGVTADYVKGFQDLGYQDISLGQLTTLKSMAITPSFIKAFNDLGYKKIPVGKLTSLKAMGVNADYVKKMRDKGFVSDDLDKYMRMKTAFD